VNLTNLMNRGVLYAVQSPRDTLIRDGKADSPSGSHLLIKNIRPTVLSYLSDDSNQVALSISALSYFNAFFLLHENRKAAGTGYAC
jgi:hypothetical protein